MKTVSSSSAVAVCHRLVAALPAGWLVVLLASLLGLLVVPALARAQTPATTTVSGIVYDPRTTASSLPLPNILVYVTTQTPDPLPAGVQCLTTGTVPSYAISSTSTLVDGTFTLANVPVSTAYTIVIQAGKWRRQFPLNVDTTPVTSLALHMPADHTQGDIPLIAIATGSADGFECVFHDMGIADSEFTDDNGTVNPGGRIHLYKGMTSAGQYITTATPSESVLVNSATLMNSYDVVMFPCQGNAVAKNSTQMANVVNFANAGGRVFATHFSYDWLSPNTPYDSQFPPVANWNPNQADPAPDPGVANINTSFTGGATLAQWLYNAGATYKGLQGEIQISTLRHDLTTVIAPTQSWITMNSSSTTGSGDIMQLTFNAPVGAPAAQQCGRVLYNEYHVINGSSAKPYPTACPTTISSGAVAQEMMLMYALYNLSAFVQPVVVPTLTLGFSPSPMVVNQGDTADQVTLTVTNTSATVAIDPSAALTIVLPPGLTATGLADSSTTGGWVCTLATLTCVRNSSIASNTADAVLLTVSVPSYSVSGITSYTGQITASVASPTFSSNVLATDNVIFQQTPTIAWPATTPIIYGTPLSATQLDATASIGTKSIPGTFVYNPAAGAILTVGTHTLGVTFTPTDVTDYTSATGTTPITIIAATPSVSLGTNAPSVFLSNAVTFTATVSSLGSVTPTGTVIFYDGATNIGTGQLNSSGQASLTLSSLAVGNHTLTASYGGDNTYNPAVSAAIPQTIEDFTLTVGGSGSATIGLGQYAFFSLTLSPVVGTTFPSAISFAASGLPPLTTVSFLPTQIASGTGSIVDTMTVTMASSFAGVNAPNRMNRGRNLQRGLPLALGVLLLPFAARMRRAARSLRGLVLIAIGALALSVGLSACSFSYNPQSSTVTVTASSGNLSHKATMKVTVE